LGAEQRESVVDGVEQEDDRFGGSELAPEFERLAIGRPEDAVSVGEVSEPGQHDAQSG
jgi:hypothetical protein